MRSIKFACAIVATMASSSAFAQQTAPNAAPNAAPQPVLTIPKSRAAAQPGQKYQIAEHGDWGLQCVRVETVAFDPCEIHQTLFNTDGAPAAEISVFPVQNDNFEAGMNFITPLETLLTKGLSFQIEQQEPQIYPFLFCNRSGCVVQTGLQAQALADMKSGSTADVIVVPAAAANSSVDLRVSLTGFTAAYDALTALPQ